LALALGGILVSFVFVLGLLLRLIGLPAVAVNFVDLENGFEPKLILSQRQI
jgi:hypothetical protein